MQVPPFCIDLFPVCQNKGTDLLKEEGPMEDSGNRTSEFKSMADHVAEQFRDSMDLERQMLGDPVEARIVYLKSLVDSAVINRFLYTLFYEMKDILAFERFVASFPNTKRPESLDQAGEITLIITLTSWA